MDGCTRCQSNPRPDGVFLGKMIREIKTPQFLWKNTVISRKILDLFSHHGLDMFGMPHFQGIDSTFRKIGASNCKQKDPFVECKRSITLVGNLAKE